MKVLFHVLLLVVLILNTKAQSYLPIPFDTLHYWIESTSSVTSPQCGAGIQLKVKYNKTFNGKIYHKIGEFGAVTTNSSTNNCYLNTQVKGYVRQDTLLKKVWILTDTVNFNETLLYDFNLNVGDTAKYLCSGCIDYPVVSAITTTILGDGLSHKVISHTVVAGFNPVYCNLIEGVGSDIGLFETSHDNPYSRKLNCFGKIINYPTNFQPVYTSLGGSCSIATYIQKNSSAYSEIEFYPNPAKDYFTILTKGEGLLELISPQGTVVKCLNTGSEKQTVVSTEGLPPGIYMLRFTSGNNFSTTKITLTKGF